jgi:hypothetical protein
MDSSKVKDAVNKMAEQRKQQRKDFSYGILEYALNHNNNCETHIGFTLNLSDSGICLYTAKYLHEGQEIVIKSKFPAGSKKATICWVEKYDSFFYKMGLKFSK